MAFYKLTYNEHHSFATVHNYGCTFRCPTCSYKLRSGPDGKPGLAYPAPEKYLTTDEIKHALRQLPIKTLNFMGGEPTIARDLPEMLDFAKSELGVRTALGHTNGSGLPLPGLDEANVGLKAWDEAIHRNLTGCERNQLFAKLKKAYEEEIDLKVNVVYIPGLIDIDQVEKISDWLGSIDRNIPFHVMGYIPVPGQTYQQPSAEQMREAEFASKKHLRNVASSRINPDHALQLSARDDRFAVTRIL